MNNIVVFSAHLDDAVLSMGDYLAGVPGSVVITFYAGAPGSSVRTLGDVRAGFHNSQEAMTARRSEDKAALTLLGAHPVHLNYLDYQYRLPNDELAMESDALRLTTELAAQTIMAPIGMVHQDHKTLAALAAQVARRGRIDRILFYEDLPYRTIFPAECERDLNELVRAQDLVPFKSSEGTATRAKRRAMHEYRSQLGPFVNDKTCLVTERLWTPRDTGAAAHSTRSCP